MSSLPRCTVLRPPHRPDRCVISLPSRRSSSPAGLIAPDAARPRTGLDPARRVRGNHPQVMAWRFPASDRAPQAVRCHSPDASVRRYQAGRQRLPAPQAVGSVGTPGGTGAPGGSAISVPTPGGPGPGSGGAGPGASGGSVASGSSSSASGAPGRSTGGVGQPGATGAGTASQSPSGSTDSSPDSAAAERAAGNACSADSEEDKDADTGLQAVTQTGSQDESDQNKAACP